MSVEKLTELQESICGDFYTAFRGNGFEETHPSPLIPQDPTVYFTSATINRFKPEISHPAFDKAYYCQQTCMRLFGMNSILLSDEKPYFSVFNMLGTFTAKDKENNMVHGIVDFLDSRNYDITIKANSQQTIPKGLSKYPVEIDTEPASYYDWKFGIKNVTGSGITFAAQKKSDKRIEIGQLITVNNHQTGASYLEFAVGVESCSRAELPGRDFRNAFLSHEVAKAHDLGDAWQLTESVTTCLFMLSAGAEPDLTKRGQTFRKALRNLAYSTLLHGKSPDELHPFIDEVSKAHKLDSCEDKMKLLLAQNYDSNRKSVEKYSKYVAMLENQIEAGGNKGQLQVKALKQAEGEYYIPEAVRTQVMSQYGLLDGDKKASFNPAFNFKCL